MLFYISKNIKARKPPTQMCKCCKNKPQDISVYLHVDTFPTFCPEVKGMVSVVVLPRSSVINAVESYAACQREQ